jgi:hypothetical protein
MTKRRMFVSKRNKTKRRRTMRKRNKNRTKRAGSPPTVECCICGESNDVGKTLMPRKCLNQHGVSAHRICQKCWWDKKTGFALEGVNHDCPGCVKGIPLNKNKTPVETVDLTGDD